MTTLTRWNPYQEMQTLWSTMDRLFGNVSPQIFGFGGQGFGLAMDITETDEMYHVEVALPGVDVNDLNISLSDNVLTIKGETKEDESYDESEYHLRERMHGSFHRSVALPGQVEADAIEANYKDGLLTLRIPKAETAKPHRIAVRADRVIEGEVQQAH